MVAVPFLRERLKPAAAVDGAKLQQLLADLDNPRFADREKATSALAALDLQAEAPLKKILARTPSAEAKQRAEKLLERLDGPLTDSERLREVRAVEALEWMATPEAKALVGTLAGGDPDARLTREAKAAAERMIRRARGG